MSHCNTTFRSRRRFSTVFPLFFHSLVHCELVIYSLSYSQSSLMDNWTLPWHWTAIKTALSYQNIFCLASIWKVHLKTPGLMRCEYNVQVILLMNQLSLLPKVRVWAAAVNVTKTYNKILQSDQSPYLNAYWRYYCCCFSCHVKSMNM